MIKIKKYESYAEEIFKKEFLRNKIRDKSKISDRFKCYFFDLTDEGWSISVESFFGYVEIVLRKNIKSVYPEKELNNIVDRMSEIRDRLSSEEGFNSHFMIYFDGIGQQDNNPITHKTDDYKFKGIDISSKKTGIFSAKILFIVI